MSVVVAVDPPVTLMAGLRQRLGSGLLAVSLPVAAIGLRFWNPGSTSSLPVPTICPFRTCTGQACPGCGLTRSVGSLLNGDVAESVRLHPLAVVVMAQALLLWVLLLVRRTGHPATLWLTRWWLGAGVLSAWLFVGVWVVRWRFGLLDAVL